MLAELTILPLGEGTHLSGRLSEVVEAIEHSGLSHQVTAMGTLIEGEPEEVWRLLRRCHELSRRHADRVVTEVRIDDGEGVGLDRSVARVEAHLGHVVRKV